MSTAPAPVPPAPAEGAPPVLLQASDVVVQFEGVRALDGVSIEVREGEVLGLIGPNGAGKTTLMNVLSGFQRPTTGSVHLGRRDVTRWGPERLARAGVARTFQAVRPFRALTVGENVQVAALGTGAGRREARQRAADVLEAMGLTGRAQDPAGSLPHGDERRLGIARALAGRPEVLLLDEPAAGTNEAESDQLGRALIAVRRDFGCTLVVIEHDMRLIMGISERIQVLDHGRTIASGDPENVRTDPQVLEAYLGHGLTERHRAEG